MMKNLALMLLVVLAIIGLLSIQKNGLGLGDGNTQDLTILDTSNTEDENDTSSENEITSFDCPLPGDGLHLANLVPEQTISFPYELEGTISPGHWAVFEAVAGSFSYFDNQTNESLGGQTSPWMIDGEWMTADPKPFSLTLPEPISIPENGEIKIVFSESNAADESEHMTHTCEVVVVAN